jgi:arylsulfatase
VRSGSTQATAQQQQPDVVCIRGDDIGWFNIGAPHQGMMSGRTPTRDTIVAQGMRFTDDAAEASDSAGISGHTQRRGGVQ